MIFIFTTPDRYTRPKKKQSNLKIGVIDISKSLDISVTRIFIILCKHSNIFAY